FLMSNGLLLLTLGLLVISSTFFFLSTKENSTVAVKKSNNFSQSGNFIDNSTAKISQDPEEILQNANEAKQKRSDNITEIFHPDYTIDYLNTDNLITEQATEQSKDKIIELPDQSIPVNINDKSNLDIETTKLNQEDLKTKFNEEKNSTNQQPEATISSKVK